MNTQKYSVKQLDKNGGLVMKYVDKNRLVCFWSNSVLLVIGL